MYLFVTCKGKSSPMAHDLPARSVLVKGGGHAGKDGIDCLSLSHIEDGLGLTDVLCLRRKEVFVARGLVEDTFDASKPARFERVIVLLREVEVAIVLSILGRLGVYHRSRRRLGDDGVYVARLGRERVVVLSHHLLKGDVIKVLITEL